jgi:hypothetical protein
MEFLDISWRETDFAMDLSGHQKATKIWRSSSSLLQFKILLDFAMD